MHSSKEMIDFAFAFVIAMVMASIITYIAVMAYCERAIKPQMVGIVTTPEIAEQLRDENPTLVSAEEIRRIAANGGEDVAWMQAGAEAIAKALMSDKPGKVLLLGFAKKETP